MKSPFIKPPMPPIIAQMFRTRLRTRAMDRLLSLRKRRRRKKRRFFRFTKGEGPSNQSIHYNTPFFFLNIVLASPTRKISHHMFTEGRELRNRR